MTWARVLATLYDRGIRPVLLEGARRWPGRSSGPARWTGCFAYLAPALARSRTGRAHRDGISSLASALRLE